MSASHAQHLSAAAREVDDFVSTAGWDQPPQLFALVPTAELVAANPELAGQVDAGAFLTPVAQDQLPNEDLAEALAGIMWPEAVEGCAVAQEIVVLPPDAEDTLPGGEKTGDTDALRRIAAEHPRRREARLVAAVLRDGSAACVLRLRSQEGDDEIIEHPELAPNLTDALLDTLR
ncbi:PPA1309 family protein [Actinophytocola sp. NPDC049390]|uniref:PPA1309 family protein n=1 Tax=Actinophytocola sp. NPDC049390 TaxID=3363894 RepID=UPI0037B62217